MYIEEIVRKNVYQKEMVERVVLKRRDAEILERAEKLLVEVSLLCLPVGRGPSLHL